MKSEPARRFSQRDPENEECTHSCPTRLSPPSMAPSTIQIGTHSAGWSTSMPTLASAAYSAASAVNWMTKRTGRFLVSARFCSCVSRIGA